MYFLIFSLIKKQNFDSTGLGVLKFTEEFEISEPKNKLEVYHKR